MDRLIKLVTELIEIATVIFILWVTVNMINWKYNPHHGLNRAIQLIWNGYR